MIIVSGEARSGTSLMMLILKKLGLSIAGDKWLSDYTPEMNPAGTWEIRGVPYQALTKKLLEKHDITEDALKIMSHKLFQSDLSLIDKLIWMIREPREVIVSQRKQVNYKDDDFNWSWYVIHMDILAKRMAAGTWPVDMLFVNYKNLIKRPRKEIRRVCDFLEVPYKGKAAKAVNKKYYRSKAKDVEDNPNARAFYNYFKPLCEGGGKCT